MYKKVKDGIYFSPRHGRIVEHRGESVRIHWNASMLDYLRRHFPTTLNEELAGCLGVSVRTVVRKARELGLEKDREWLSGVWDERRRMAHAASRKKGFPGCIKKGERRSPETMFKKGHVNPPEVVAVITEKLSRWCLTHPVEASARARKAWVTRRKNIKV